MITRAKRNYYLIGFLGVLALEIVIAICLKTGFIRANAGDFLAALLLYCLLMMFTNTSVKTGLILTLLFCFTVELLQIVNLTRFFPEKHKWWTDLLFGSHFSWLDLLMYALGIVMVWWIEKVT